MVRASTWAKRVSAFVVFAVFVAGCTPLERGERAPDTEPQPELVDEAGVVRDWKFHLWDDGREPDLDVSFDERTGAVANTTNAPPPGWDLRIAWKSGPCGRAPTVTIEASSGALTSIVVEDPNVLPPDPLAACPAMAIPHAVDLKLEVTPPGETPVKLVRAGCHIAPFGVTPSPMPECPDVSGATPNEVISIRSER